MTGAVPNEGPPPAPMSTEITVAAPPSVDPNDGRAVLTRMIPVVMAAAMLGVTVFLYRSAGPVGRSPMFGLFPLMLLASAGAAAVHGRERFRGNDIDQSREKYLGYLTTVRGTVRRAAEEQRAFLCWSHPDPDTLWLIGGGPRMWHRRPGDPLFGSARVGTGMTPAVVRPVGPDDDPVRRIDPVTEDALRRFLDTYGVVPETPIALPILGGPALLIDGDRDRARGLARALICQLAALHGPEALLIAVVPGDRPAEWDWLKWLPHHQHPSAMDAAGPSRLRYPDPAAADHDLSGRRAVLVSDDATGLRVTEVGVRGPIRRLQLTETTLSDAAGLSCRPDALSRADALVCARRLAAYRSEDRGASGRGWAGLMGIADIERFDPAARWADAPGRRLCVPIGIDDRGDPVELDLREAAEQGSGPHGLCIGATGSGKSEFLRTLILGLATRHSPDALNFILVDFKGGATFLGFEAARHVAAVITNLAAEAALVERMHDALSGELHRRQELLRAAGATGIRAYARARGTGQPQLPALPALLIVVDEFSELLHQHPDFLDTFVAIGRLGRSLGVHLLLASQRLDEGRLRGLEAHLSYRVCLKTMSAAESRIVLGTADAHELPNSPGLGYLRTADGAIRRFQTAYVSGPCPSAPPAGMRPVPFTAAPSGAVERTAATSERTVVHAMLQQICGHGTRAREIWLAPLGDSPELGSLLEDRYPELTVPIGVVDRPFDQRRTPLSVRLGGAEGHLAVVGAPQSGKTTALRTLIAALSATHDASRINFYCLDFGGGGLSSVGGLPQVGAVADRGNPDLVRRIVAELGEVLARREAGRPGRHGADGDADPDIFLVIDGWAGLCREFEVESAVVALAAHGLSHGLHIVLSAPRWADVRPALRDLIGTRIELRLGDPAESELDRRQAQRVPRDRPGRGLTRDGMHMLVARPQGCEPLRHPGGVVAAPIQPLPTRVDRAGLVTTVGTAPALGIDERALEVAAVDFQRQPHLIILGDNECGKTSVLRTLCRELVRANTTEQARLLVVDYRRGLLDAVPPEHLAGYAVSAAALTALLPGWIEMLAGRMPGADVSVQRLRDRSWWSGPHLYVVVDDYDLVAAAAGNPLVPLLDYLPHAGDLGLHLVVARRSGGVARSMYEPMLATLQDLGAMRLMMSTDPADCPPGPARPRVLPPGRGTLITRADGERLIQVAWEP